MATAQSIQVTETRLQFRNEDFPRRSACNRCRDHKLRCNRPISISNLTNNEPDCQRCVRAQVSCQTTFAARPYPAIQPVSNRKTPRTNDYGDSGQQRRKNRGVSTDGSGRKREIRELPQQKQRSLIPLPQSDMNMLPLNGSEHSSPQNAQVPNERLPQVQQQQQDPAPQIHPVDPAFMDESLFATFYDFVEGWDGYDPLNFNPPPNTNQFPIPPSNSPFANSILTPPPTSSTSTQTNHEKSSQNTPPPDFSLTPPPTTPLSSLLDQIMNLSIAYAQESRCAKKHAMPGRRLKAILLRILQNSEDLVSLMRDIVALSRLVSDPPSTTIPETHDTRTNIPGHLAHEEHISGEEPAFILPTESTFHLLTATTSLLANYTVFGTILHSIICSPQLSPQSSPLTPTTPISTPPSQANADILPHLEIFDFPLIIPSSNTTATRATSSTLQLKLLTQVCLHTITEIQHGLEEVWTSGVIGSGEVERAVFESVVGKCEEGREGEKISPAVKDAIGLMNRIAKSLSQRRTSP